VTINPYLINVKKDIEKSLLFNIPSHIIPASAPIGVIFAPRFDPTITAKVTKNCKDPDIVEIIGTKATLIGILFKTLATNADPNPNAKIL
jgi:hypothetical protein